MSTVIATVALNPSAVTSMIVLPLPMAATWPAAVTVATRVSRLLKPGAVDGGAVLPSLYRTITDRSAVSPARVNVRLGGAITSAVGTTASTSTGTSTLGSPSLATVIVADPFPVEVTSPVLSTIAMAGWLLANRAVRPRGPVVPSEKRAVTERRWLWKRPCRFNGFGVTVMPTIVVKSTTTGTPTGANAEPVTATRMVATPLTPGSTSPPAEAEAMAGAVELNVRPVVSGRSVPSLNRPTTLSCCEVFDSIERDVRRRDQQRCQGRRRWHDDRDGRTRRARVADHNDAQRVARGRFDLQHERAVRRREDPCLCLVDAVDDRHDSSADDGARRSGNGDDARHGHARRHKCRICRRRRRSARRRHEHLEGKWQRRGVAGGVDRSDFDDVQADGKVPEDHAGWPGAQRLLV